MRLSQTGHIAAYATIIVLLISCTSAGDTADAEIQADVWSQGDIAYVHQSGNINIVDRTGSMTLDITSDAVRGRRTYTSPTWSPDGRMLAFAGQDVESGFTLFVRSELQTRAILQSTDQAPIYLSFSPNGETISVITSGKDGVLTLQTVSITNGAIYETVRGAPIFWDWIPDSSGLIIHSGDVHSASGSTLTYQRMGGEPQLEAVAAQPVGFRSPDVSPKGFGFLSTVLNEEGGMSLSVIYPDSQIKVTAVSGISAFAWSYDGKRVASLDGQTYPGFGLIGELSIHTPGGRSVTVDSSKPQNGVAFFSWAPDGGLLFGMPGVSGEGRDARMTMGLQLMHPVTEEPRFLFNYQPTQTYLSQIMPFFDQYERSHKIWAPDASAFLLSAIMEDGSSGVVVVDVGESNVVTKTVGQGDFPVWRPGNRFQELN